MSMIDLWFTSEAVIEEVTNLLCRSPFIQARYVDFLLEGVPAGDGSVRALPVHEQPEFRQLVRSGVVEGIERCNVTKRDWVGRKNRNAGLERNIQRVLERYAHFDVPDELLRIMAWAIYNHVYSKLQKHTKESLQDFTLVLIDYVDGGPTFELTYEEYARKKKRFERLQRKGKIRITFQSRKKFLSDFQSDDSRLSDEEQAFAYVDEDLGCDWLVGHTPDPEALCMAKELYELGAGKVSLW